MTRRVGFSAGRVLRGGRLDAHDWTLDVETTGPVDPATGMIVNIKRVDDVLKERVLGPLDGRVIDDPSPERLALRIRDDLADRLPAPATFAALTLSRRGLAVRVDATAMVEITRTYEFAAAHRLHSPALTDEDNLAVYGKCNHPAGHGHNYVLEVTVATEISPTTGFARDAELMDDTVNYQIVDRYDHRNLDVDVEELAGRPTTSENVALAIHARLSRFLPIKRVRLWETARNAFTVES